MRKSQRTQEAAYRKRGRLFVISAPSGCGKTTLCKKILSRIPALTQSISMTTRPPRKKEKNGVDYFFVSGKKFRETIRRRGFLEYEDNFGYMYGTPKAFVESKLKEGVSLVLSIDVKGAVKVKKAYPKESVLIFILPPSASELKKRLVTRMSDDDKSIAARLGLAKREMACKDKYDYRVVNDRLDHAYKKLKKIITRELHK